MGIKKNAVSSNTQKMREIQKVIKNLLAHEVLKEVPDLKKDIESLLEKANKVTFKSDNVNVIKGKIYNVEEIINMIKDSSNYTNWKLSESETLDVENLQELKEEYSIDFEEKKISRHMIYRRIDDRDAVSVIIVTALPDLFKVELYTDRVGYGLEGLVDEKQFKSGIMAETN